MARDQRHLPLVQEPWHHLLAKPTGSGFFGLSDFQLFAAEISPFLQQDCEETLLLDFSQVRMWDVSVLLWLTLALHHYRREGLPFLLRLPDGDEEGDKDGTLTRSADFLRRWKFGDALRNITLEPSDLLIPEQQDYFSKPTRHYSETSLTSQKGLQETLISRRLVHIRNLADPSFLGEQSVSDERITECIAEFQTARIGDILTTTCGIPKQSADLFSEHLLSESLQNVKEHPDATIGMVSISVLGSSGELVLAVADNGKSIPETILPAYEDELGRLEGEGADNQTRLKQAAHRKVADIADYATQPGKSRKQVPDHGMGLTYIKEDTVRTLNGKFRMLTESVCLRYENEMERPTFEVWKHEWPGNLLRIAIPIRPRANLHWGPR